MTANPQRVYGALSSHREVGGEGRNHREHGPLLYPLLLV